MISRASYFRDLSPGERLTGAARVRTRRPKPGDLVLDLENIMRSKVTTATLAALRTRGEKAVFVTAYDFPTAVFADRAGVDMMLVGDSAGMTMMGLPSTISVTMADMEGFVRSVC